MKKIAVIGCGGIQSFFVRELNQLFMNSVEGTKDIQVVLFDGDIVEEKNLRYQNFKIEDLDEPKAKVLSERYLFEYKNKYIEDGKELDTFDIIVIGVDNGKLRDLVFRYVEDKPDKYFIDMRSEGRAIMALTKHEQNDLKYLLSTIDKDKPATSCQLKFELDAGKIQVGNRIIAMVGIQMLLNYLRGDKNIPRFIQRI